MLQNIHSSTSQPMPAIVEPKAKRMSKGSTAQWLDEFSQAPASNTLSVAQLGTMLCQRIFKFDWCDGPKYGVKVLCFHEGEVQPYRYSKLSSAILLDTPVFDVHEMYKTVFNEQVADKIAKLSKYVVPGALDMLAIGFPLSNRLEDFVDRMCLKFETDSQHALLIEYGCNASNFQTVLEKEMKNEPRLTPGSYPLHFLAHPLWRTCLLRRSDEDQKQDIMQSPSRNYAAILWFAKQYPLWQKVVLEKVCLLKAVLAEKGPDVTPYICRVLMIKSLQQPIKEVTAALSAETKAKKRIQSQERPARAKRQKID